MEAFLLDRAHEIVCGGLMFILVPAIADETLLSKPSPGLLLDVLESCLMELAKMDIVDEAKLDSFNMPSYITSPEQVEELVERTRCFTIERLERLETLFPLSSGAKILANHMRSASEEIFKQHFGFSDDDLDKLIELYSERLVDPLSIFTKSEDKSFQMFLVLKRNSDIVDEAKVDSFNLTSYLTSPKQVKE
ncbi:farnesoic acid carboxyl-O-methyltransferase-like [Papaver somniferum]|uniref:farnesoic acid carboxyl-O-methyltransferase-like n=1 Tax=Papaver somniferum TaxID=3469 RepID=UPI000E6FDC39|nr:farnesoic acid carboxyl-O-methyltransferase-like [Papaver somniferum]